MSKLELCSTREKVSYDFFMLLYFFYVRKLPKKVAGLYKPCNFFRQFSVLLFSSAAMLVLQNSRANHFNISWNKFSWKQLERFFIVLAFIPGVLEIIINNNEESY